MHKNYEISQPCNKIEGTNNYTTLSKVKKGGQARLIEINISDRKLRQRFLDMGLTKDVLVRVKSVAPFGSPITLVLRDYELSVRKADLHNIIVELV